MSVLAAVSHFTWPDALVWCVGILRSRTWPEAGSGECRDRLCRERCRVTRKARMNTAIRSSPELHARLKEAAEDRDLSINFLVVKAVEDFLPRLAETVTLTKEH